MIAISTMETSKLEYVLKISPRLKKTVEFFEELDGQYKVNAFSNRNSDDIVMFSPKHIINKEWIGLWLKATGMDLDLYLNWLYAGLTIPKYKTSTLEFWYKEAHPKEKYIPYSISKANKDLHEIIDK